jgi:hypothetical protein
VRDDTKQALASIFGPAVKQAEVGLPSLRTLKAQIEDLMPLFNQDVSNVTIGEPALDEAKKALIVEMALKDDHKYASMKFTISYTSPGGRSFLDYKVDGLVRQGVRHQGTYNNIVNTGFATSAVLPHIVHFLKSSANLDTQRKVAAVLGQ